MSWGMHLRFSLAGRKIASLLPLTLLLPYQYSPLTSSGCSKSSCSSNSNSLFKPPWPWRQCHCHCDSQLVASCLNFQLEAIADRLALLSWRTCSRKIALSWSLDLSGRDSYLDSNLFTCYAEWCAPISYSESYYYYYSAATSPATAHCWLYWLQLQLLS